MVIHLFQIPDAHKPAIQQHIFVVYFLIVLACYHFETNANHMELKKILVWSSEEISIILQLSVIWTFNLSL